MKHTAWTALTLIPLVAAGCAGTLDDDYFNSDQSAPATAWADGGTPRPAARDGGAAWRDAGGANAEPDAEAASAPYEPAAMHASPSAADSGTRVAPDSGSPLTTPAVPVSGISGPPDAGPPCDFRGLVQMKCASASCHGAPATTSGLDLTSASLATRVAGRKAIGSCQDAWLIDKANPAQSALYLRVSSVACGVKMPLGGTLTPNEQACILSWIEGL